MKSRSRLLAFVPARYERAFLSAWAVTAAFGAYFCMYGFRKPFTAAKYLDWGEGTKTTLVTAQVLGYMLSKFIGIKVVAELAPAKRAIGVLVLIVVAQLALVLFALAPPALKPYCLFLNGLPLGMVFGLVLGFLEGRRMTEALTAGLCASFILAGGVTKTVGESLLLWGVSEQWMPAAAGLLFLTPTVLFVVMLQVVPAPDEGDVAQRGERLTMTRQERWDYFRRFAPGLVLLVAMYLLVTILRSIRDDFAPELWAGLGRTGEPGIFTRSEVFVALGVMAVNGLFVLVANNRRAFFGSLAVALAGQVLIVIALMGWERELLGDLAFMILTGLGLYLPYVAVHTTVFERLIAVTGGRATLGYLMYLADAFGYLGYVAVMLVRQWGRSPSAVLPLFQFACWVTVGLCAACLIGAWVYFAPRLRKDA